MKKLLLSIALIGLLLPNQSQAVNLGEFYVVPKLTLTSGGNLGIGANIAIGYDLFSIFGFPMRAELEIGTRYSSDSLGDYEFSYIYIPVLVSAYYDFHFNSNFTPYIGAGVGVNYISVSSKWSGASSNIADTREGEFDFNLVFTAGLSYAMSDTVDIDIAYSFNFTGGVGSQGLIGARYKF